MEFTDIARMSGNGGLKFATATATCSEKSLNDDVKPVQNVLIIAVHDRKLIVQLIWWVLQDIIVGGNLGG